MAMQWIDWGIVVGLLVFLIVMAVYTKRHTKSVADFLAANRCAGRYLITASAVELGAITVIAYFEMFYDAGFTAAWWRMLWFISMTVVSLTGWVIYRFRQTRVLTLGQFLEIRYSKRFRIFVGFVAWTSGIVNFGIFPAVNARFLIYFCGIPEYINIFGFNVSTFVLIIITLLAIAYYFTFIGGQIAVIVTDCIQETFCNIVYIFIILVVLSIFSWSQITESLLKAPEGASMLHPFRAEKAEDFNLWFYLIGAIGYFYTGMIWQGNQGCNASGLNAHEARMGKILSTWRILSQNLFMLLLPVCAYTFMHHPDFASAMAQAKDIIASIGNPQIQKQMTTPIAMRFFLPAGIMGCFVAVMFAALTSTDNTYMHSWGSIFLQDVIMPFRKKPFAPRQHIILLRLSILFVAVFVCFFSILFRQNVYIFMFMWITGAIFNGGAGAVIIGGLYWKRGTTMAAWSSLITGGVLAAGSIILKQVHDKYPFTGIIKTIASQNGAILFFYVSIIAIAVYIIVSLLGKKTIYNLDRMLHRGKFAVEEYQAVRDKKPVGRFCALIGMGSEFNLRDKIVYLAIWGWNFLLIAVFIAGTIYNYIVEVKTESWITFWWYYVRVLLVISILTTVWLAVGGILDIRRMFKLLGKVERNDLDDGMVLDHYSLGEEPTEEVD